MSKSLAACAALAALIVAPAAFAGGPAMLVGAAEDSIRQPSLVAAKSQLDLLRLGGLNAVRVTTTWAPGASGPSQGELGQLENVEGASKLTGVRVLVQVMNAGSKTTPLMAQEQRDFAAYAAATARRFRTFKDFVIGNEPNLNRFWLPQYGVGGEDVAAVAYEGLLAQTYDALKAVSPDITVLGGALAPRGSDNPSFSRPTHSPTAFIRDMGAAYRASGRALPLMDQFAMHPYEDHSGLPPSFQHPNTSTIALADYGKLVTILGEAFDGTAQPGSSLSIVYDEFGVESAIPATKAALYSGTEPTTTHAVAEPTQATYYRDALAIAFCQPNVRGFFFFHTVDERPLDRWQSGIFYADETPKSGFDVVKSAVRSARGGTITRCTGLELTPVPVLRVKVSARQHTVPAPILTCDIDCTYRVRLEKVSTAGTVAALYGKALSGEAAKITFRPRRLAPGRYRFTARVTAPVNTGEPGIAATAPFTIR